MDETRYRELFDRYITHVSYWVKGEKLRNPLTGQYEDPDPRLLSEVEALLGTVDKPEDLRHSLIGRVAAWAIDHPGDVIDNSRVFSAQLKRMQDAVFAERRVAVAKLARDMLSLFREDVSGLDDARRAEVRSAIDRLKARFGYDEASASDAVTMLVRERLADLLH